MPILHTQICYSRQKYVPESSSQIKTFFKKLPTKSIQRIQKKYVCLFVRIKQYKHKCKSKKSPHNTSCNFHIVIEMYRPVQYFTFRIYITLQKFDTEQAQNKRITLTYLNLLSILQNIYKVVKLIQNQKISNMVQSMKLIEHTILDFQIKKKQSDRQISLLPNQQTNKHTHVQNNAKATKYVFKLRQYYYNILRNLFHFSSKTYKNPHFKFLTQNEIKPA
eukprot:TRINITY_DN421_c0_g1_i1.p4 TRINITY_DN421_c0_g1~~TRINITY_DN421_c0_g1_i1.p4  ORF type:complete len:220 (-),score=-9.21 TRINITY_DN421_c0_g1_i1:1855-2514(-)